MNRDDFLEMTSFADWHWGETAMLTLFVIIAVLTLRSVAQRDRAIWVGRSKKDEESRRAAYEARWRTGGPAGV